MSFQTLVLARAHEPTGLLAAGVEAWPAAAVNRAQQSVFRGQSYWVTFFTLQILASPIPVFMYVVGKLLALGILRREGRVGHLWVALFEARRKKKSRR